MDRILQVGPLGGIYYVNSSGRKIYVSKNSDNKSISNGKSKSKLLRSPKSPKASKSTKISSMDGSIYSNSHDTLSKSPKSPRNEKPKVFDYPKPVFTRSPKPRNSVAKTNGKLTPQQQKYCRCVKKVEAKGTAYNPFAVCAKSTGTTMGRGHCPK